MGLKPWPQNMVFGCFGTLEMMNFPWFWLLHKLRLISLGHEVNQTRLIRLSLGAGQVVETM
jgi:hypothetical protein